MHLSLIARLAIDLGMLALVLAALAYGITGDASHEWIGIAILVLFVVHNASNWHWYKGLFKGKYDFRRMMIAVVNLLLLAAMTALMISAVLLSRTVFAWFSGGMQIRQVHTIAAYWGLILIALHIGMHWEMIMGARRRMPKSAAVQPVRTIIMRTVSAMIVIYGVYASFDREMGAKLFMGYSFDFWNPDRPVVLFFTNNLAIMGMYACITYYALKVLAYRRAIKQG